MTGNETACKMGVSRCFVKSPSTQSLLTNESENSSKPALLALLPAPKPLRNARQFMRHLTFTVVIYEYAIHSGKDFYALLLRECSPAFASRTNIRR